MTGRHEHAVAQLLAEHGTTFAEEARIPLRDKPSPLYRLLRLATLSAIPVAADVAVAAEHELGSSGWRTPEALLASTWQQRVDALGRAHYRRYDEGTATVLAEQAEHLQHEWSGDLRNLRDDAEGDPRGQVHGIHRRLRAFPRIGRTGADIFCREVQAVWPQVRPFVDERARRRAAAIGLPHSATGLARLVPDDRLAVLTAALVRSEMAERHAAA